MPTALIAPSLYRMVQVSLQATLGRDNERGAIKQEKPSAYLKVVKEKCNDELSSEVAEAIKLIEELQ